MKTSIIIPAYNEKDTIKEVLERVSRLDLEKEIIVVDDGSTDGTYQIAKRFDVLMIRHERNMGKGRAIRTGLDGATGDIVVIQDSDLEYPPEQIPKMVQLITDKQTDIVFGSRFIGRSDGMNLTHQIGNRIITAITNILYGSAITDMETGHKAFRKDVVDGIKLTAERFEIEPELTAKILKKGYKIREIPVEYTARKEGSKIGKKDGFIALWWLLLIRLGVK